MKKYLLIFSLLFVGFIAHTHAQYQVVAEAYSVENGLSQNSVTDMLKDDEGFLWFTTRDGLSRFDGYNFKNYKASSKELKRSISNQFKEMLKDDYGFLWIVNYMGQAFRFDPKTETFQLHPSADENRGDNYISIRNLIKMPSGEIWMISYGNGCIRAVTDTSDFSVSLTAFCTQEQSKTGHEVRSVYQDKDLRTWIFTGQGIAVVSKDETIPSAFYLTEQEDSTTQNSLFTSVETKEELLVAGSAGRIFRYNKSKKRFTTFQLPVKSDLNNMLELRDSVCFISTAEDGFFLFNYNTNAYRHFHAANTKMPADEIENSWKDKNGDVWMKINDVFGFMRFNSTEDKLYYMPFRYAQEDFSSLAFLSEPAFSLSFIDDKDKIWSIPSARKTSWYNDNYTKSKPYFENEKENLFPSVLHKSFTDTTGVIWMTTHYKGIQKCVSLNPSFRFTQCENSQEYAETNDILALFEDDKQRLWIATQDNKVRIYDKTGQLLGFLNRRGEITKTESPFANIISIYQDRKGIFWFGANPGLYKLEPKNSENESFTVRSYTTSKEGLFSPASLVVNDLLEDSRGRIWLATSEGGLQLLDESEGKLRFIHKNNLLKNNYPPAVLQTRCLFEDTNGNIWVGSSEGITVFSNEFDNPENIKFFFYNPENTDLLNSSISDIYQDKSGIMWFASFGGGLFNISDSFYLGETPDFITYNKENKKFPSDLALSIQEDEQGFLWIVTEDAIVKFDKKESVAELFGKISGLDQIGFSERTTVKKQSGEFIVGTTSGFYSFYPDRIRQTEYKPKIVLTRFQLFNKDVELGRENSPLQSTINTTEEITLTHKQSVFSVEYAALDYRNPAHIQYAYKLDNFEENWNYVGSQRVASYTNLPQGVYYFRVKSTNSEGVWFDNDKILKITILPSFWQTGWAYLLYALAIVLVIGITITIFIVFYRMRSRMRLDREISAMKLQFFTDVSHELRTPLTLINAPLENVLESKNLAKQDKEQLEIVHANTNRMLRLMNQILDFRKIQNNKMRLRVEKTKLGDFVVACSSNFRKIAENRNIHFHVEDKTNGAFFWIDKDKIDTLIFNLLSNAFKFTESGKSVSVSVSIDNGDAVIRIEDEGCGMPKDKLSLIFDRFVTLQPTSLTKQTGTGIGLSLVKEIVELHKATISVSSQERKGTQFEVRIKSGIAHLENTDVIICDETPPETQEEKKNTAAFDEKSSEIPTLLVIEDNDELRAFLVSVLSGKFNILEAPNGEIGWQKTWQEMPDFVITDIMMPELDGIAYTRRVRENERTSHIPIILLTAKTDMESKLECLKIGANDYITKPFSMTYLETRVENILKERKKWQEKYRNELLKDQPLQVEKQETETPKAETQDDILMRKLVESIEKQMDNSELSLDDILDELKISRWNLTSKVKALVGLTPNEFIRETRLARAAKLIEEGEYNMTQITYMIGMTDSRYFSRCFKQKFGMTPTEYKTSRSKKS